jgi:cobalt-zinc-cadmium efflux system outer membrane protein
VPEWSEPDVLAALERGSQALWDARAAEASARGDLTQAGLVPNPQLSVGASNLPLRSNDSRAGDGPGLRANLVTSLGIEQTLELGGKRGKRVAQARSALAAAEAGGEDARRAARFEVRRAFWDAIRAREKLKLAQAVRARMEESVRVSRARFAAEDVSGTDLEKVELEALAQLNDLADAVATERTALASLLALLGPAAPSAVRLSGDLAAAAGPVDPAQLARRARDLRPDLRAARRQAEAARLAGAVAEAAAVPDLTVALGYLHSRAVLAGDNPDTLALTVSVPLPLFHRNQGEIAKAQAGADRAERTAAALEARVAREVEAAAARYRAAAEKVARYDGGALARADHLLAVAEKTWRAGDRSLLELLEAERTWTALRSDYLDTLFELREARLDLERAVGAPVEESRS